MQFTSGQDRILVAEPLTTAAFASFGEIVEAPPETGRQAVDEALGSARAQARPRLRVSRVEAVANRPVRSSIMERHAFSSQTFIPLADVQWLVIVAPQGQDDRPNMQGARAFLPAPGQGVTYRRGTWHHPNTVLSGTGLFAVLIWEDGTSDDEQFADVEHFRVDLGGP